MKQQLSRRKMLQATGAGLAATLAGCAADGKSSDNTPTDSSNRLSAEEMEWMDRPGDITYAEFAENSAELHARNYNQDMEMTGKHIDTAPERDSLDNPIVDLDSVQLTFTEADSDAPAERYQAELRMSTDPDSIYSDFEGFEDHEEVFNERIAQLFGTVMMPTIGTLFTDAVGPDYRASQADIDNKAVEGIEYILEDNSGNKETIHYDRDGVDYLSQTFEDEINQKEAFYEEALEQIE